MHSRIYKNGGRNQNDLKKLTVENFGKIDFFETSFDPQLTVFSDKCADDIIKAIGLVTNNKTLSGSIKRQMLSNHTRISAVLEIQGGTFLLNFAGIPPNSKREAFALDGNRSVNSAELLESIRLCKEESLAYYRFDCNNEYSNRFFKYREYNKYYSRGEFGERTDGAGITGSFRACLTRYIREYKAECFSSIGYKAELLPDGRFVRHSAGILREMPVFYANDSKLFDYMCYGNINDFWEQFENIRNMHYEKWPNIVDATGLLSVPGSKELLFRSENRDRQRIIKTA